MAPEIVKKSEYNAKQTDIWALGILAFRMLYGNPPFKAPSEKELYAKIIKGTYQFPENDDVKSSEFNPRKHTKVSKRAKDMIQKMLLYRGEQRPTAGELLKFDWMQD